MQATERKEVVTTPWNRGQFTTRRRSGAQLKVHGWISKDGLWGLYRDDPPGERYSITHLHTRRGVLRVPNHESATHFLIVLNNECNMSNCHIENGKTVGVDGEKFWPIALWAREYLGATRDHWLGEAVQGDK